MPIYPSGTLIANRYEIVQGPREKPSLAGGMGLVYLCVDHAENEHPVALKTFRPELLPDRAARDRFLREGTTWVELGKHPHIVRCYQVFKDIIGPEVFFVLDLVAGAEGKRDASLRSWLMPGKPLSLEQALLFALHIARGMKHATTKIPSLVHRDMKPENVLVGRDGIARVSDFGLANAIQVTDSNLPEATDKMNQDVSLRKTQLTRGIVGTPLYMAPEQWEGTEVDVRADIYAFGFIFYEMITGKFAIFSKNVREIEEAHRTRRMSEMPLNLSKQITQLLQQCLAVNREKRYSNWIEVETEIANSYKMMIGRNAPIPIDFSADTYPERVITGWSYNAMGLSYCEIGKLKVAVEYFENVIRTGRDLKENSLEGAGLCNLGRCYDALGDFKRAIGFYEQALTIARKIEDPRGEGLTLSGLGITCAKLGQIQKAIGFFEQHLAIARRIGDMVGEEAALGNLGRAFDTLGDVSRAIVFYEQHLTIARKIGDRVGEGTTLGNLGNAYLALDNVKQAIKFFEQHLSIAQEIGDRAQEANALGNLGSSYSRIGDTRGAISFYEQHLTIAREIGDRMGEGLTLNNLGIAYYSLREMGREIEFYEKSFSIAQELGNLMVAAMTSFNLASLLFEQGQQQKALHHADNAVRLYAQIGHKLKLQQSQELRARILSQLR